MSSPPDTAARYSPFQPLDPEVLFHFGYGSGGEMNPFLLPCEHRGWRPETMSWKKTAYLHATLNPSPTARLTGTAVLEFLSQYCVNSFAKFAVGGSKHAVMCNEHGHLMAHGMLLRTGEQEFLSYWLAPWIAYVAATSGLDVQVEDLTGQVFLHQIAGPRSLEVLENATGEDLRDIRFLRHRRSYIAGTEIRIVRVGMAGSLAYEVHGPIEFAYPVHNAIHEAGQPYGLERLGRRAYMCQHTENGFPNVYIHFPLANEEVPPYAAFIETLPIPRPGNGVHLRGSMGADPERRYVSPIELGWANIVKFDHHFLGREALEREAASPRRTMVTLEWNAEDVLDVMASHLRSGDEYQAMEMPNHFPYETGRGGNIQLWADRVLLGDDEVGVSSGRTYTQYYRRVLSLCTLDVEHAVLGTEVTVIWGEPGHPQKRIRATVARFPYFDENRNEAVDVTALPAPEPAS